MTTTTGTGRHPDVAEISALTEGLLSPDRNATVREHIAGCELCADVHGSLTQLRGLLGTLPGPVGMPADVAGRIDAALAAEALLDSTAPGAVSRETRAPRNPGTGEDAPASVSRETSEDKALAAAESTRTDDNPRQARPAGRPAGHSHAATGPGRRPVRRRRWHMAVLGAASALGIGVGGVVLAQMSGPSGDAGAGSDRPLASGLDSGLTASALEGRVQELLTQSSPETGKAHSPSDGIGAQSSPAEPLRGSEVSVPSCVRAGIDRAATPLAAAPDTFEGKQAYVVVLPDPSDATRVNAFVVDASCVSAEPHEPGEVLLTRSFSRP